MTDDNLILPDPIRPILPAERERLRGQIEAHRVALLEILGRVDASGAADPDSPDYDARCDLHAAERALYALAL